MRRIFLSRETKNLREIRKEASQFKRNGNNNRGRETRTEAPSYRRRKKGLPEMEYRREARKPTFSNEA